MKNYLLKMAVPAAFLLALHLTGAAQIVTSPGEVVDDADTIAPAARARDEIIIRHKTDKDAKVTIEIKNGEVFINGKPASEYEDDNIAITKRKIKTFRNGKILMDGGEITMSPFRNQGGVWNLDGDNFGGERAFLGVSSMRSDDGPAGAKVNEITAESAAKKAGLELGDLITKVDDISIESPEDLSRAIRGYKPGDKVTITFKRDGKEQKVTATLGKTRNMSYSYKLGPGSDNFDFKQFTIPPGAYNFSYGNSARLGIRAQDTEDGKGVKVLDVDEESAAAKAGIKQGDVITQFDGKEVNNAPALANAARESRTKTSVHVNLLRGGKPLEVDIKTPRKLRTADL